MNVELGAASEPSTSASSDHETTKRQPLTWLLAVLMLLTALLIAVPGFLERPSAAVPDARWLGLLPLFAAAEVVVIYLPTQRNAHGHTLREIPAVLGLTFLAPQQYVTAYVVGAVLALAVAARMRGVKLAFNGAMFALEAALGAATYHAILQGGHPLSYTGWVAVLAAVLVTDLISAGAVTAAISLTEGAFDGEVLHEALRSGSVAAFINTCVALLVATLVLVQPTALPLLGVVIVLLIASYRVYVSLARGHAQTRLLYQFVDRTSAARSSEEVIEIVLRETADLMHAEHAYLIETLGPDSVRHHCLVGGALQVGSLERPDPGAWWWSALDRGVVRHERPRHGHGHGARSAAAAAAPRPLDSPRDGLATGLGGAGLTRCVLVVCDRSFEKETFGTEDEQVFGALAAHAGVALERARTVSDLEALASELEVARDDALAASEAKSLFLANMSHEVRTPLTIMLATAEILEDTDLSELQRNLVERMQRSGGSLKSLVESILDFSRLESGQLDVAVKPFDLHTLIADATDAYAMRASRTGNRFTSDVATDVPRIVVGDSGRLFQVVSNLLDNALKFSHQGQVDLVVRRTEVGLGAGGDESRGAVEYVVRDTGIGIAPEDQASIFEVFRQVDGTATRHYDGTGLGLAICKQLTELMGGTIAVSAELGVGSTFTVTLPLLEAPPASGAPTSPDRAHAPA